jgi:hypothetical protein
VGISVCNYCEYKIHTTPKRRDNVFGALYLLFGEPLLPLLTLPVFAGGGKKNFKPMSHFTGFRMLLVRE